MFGGHGRAVVLHNQAVAAHGQWRQSPEQLFLLERALDLWRKALSQLHEQDQHFPWIATCAADAYHDRFERAQRLPDLDAAVALMERATRYTPPADYLGWIGRYSGLRMLLAQRFAVTGSEADAVGAAVAGRAVAQRVADDDPDARAHRHNAAEAIAQLGDLQRDTRLLDEALDWYHRAAQSWCPDDGHPDRAYGGAAGCAVMRYRITGDLADLRTAIGMAEQAVALCHGRPGPFLDKMAALGSALTVYCKVSGDLETLDTTVDRLTAAVTQWRREPGHHDVNSGATILLTHATALELRYLIRDAEEDFYASRHHFEEALALATSDRSQVQPKRLADIQYRLGMLLAQRCERDPAALSELRRISDLAEASAARIPVGDWSHGLHLALLGDVRRLEGERNWDRALLEEAAALYANAARELRPQLDEASRVLARRTRALIAMFQRDGSEHTLHQVVAAAEEALRSAVPGDPFPHSDVGLALRMRYEFGGDPQDLEQALHHARTAARLLRRTDDPNYAIIQSNLALVLAAPGHAAALADGSSVLRTALLNGNVTPAARALLDYNLGTLLRDLAAATGDGHLLVEALEYLQQAVRDAPPSDANLGLYHCGLAGALHALYDQGDATPADLDEAVAAAQAAIGVPTGGAHRAASLYTLGNLLTIRHGERDDPADLDRAAEALREARDLLHRDHFYTGPLLTQYGEVLRTQALQRGRTEAYAAALAPLREGLWHCPPDQPSWAMAALFLADALLEDPDAEESAYLEAQGLYRRAANHPTGVPALRLQAAMNWGRLLVLREDWAQALRAYTTAIGLLPLAAWPGLPRRDRLRALRTASELSGVAASVALNAGAPQCAVELLEAARGQLLSHALNMRSDLEVLRQHDASLAEELERVRREMNTIRTKAVITADSVPKFHQHAERQRQLQRRWDELTDRARSMPGLERFLLPPSFEDLSAAGDRGPVVLLNTSLLRSDALILTRGSVTVLPLPDLDVTEAERRAGAWAELLSDPDADLAAAVRPMLRDLVGWLWETITGPVLRTLDASREPGEGGHPSSRLWWCPSGPLNRLPLHAACPAAGGGDAADHFVPSYTPTVRALLAARAAAPSPRAVPRPLFVGVSKVPGTGLDDLPGVIDELHQVGNHLAPNRKLNDATATREEVLAVLPNHDWLHFAGHGGQTPDSADGVLYTWDHAATGSIRVADISDLRLIGAQLAFLSACETLRAPVGHPDEAVHLAGAMQLAGFRHVVAAQWRIGSQWAIAVAEDFYAALKETDGRPNPDRAAYALHGALRRLQADRADAIERWTPYVHVGP